MQIAFVAYDRMTALDLIGPMEVLTRIPGASTEVVATRTDTFTADNGALRFTPTRHVDEVPAPDIIVVPGGTAGTRRAMQDSALLDWLVRASATATWTTSVCTGSLILGAAGLLHGRRATTHWVALDELRDHGAIPVTERVVIDGNVLTAAGVSAGIDMGLTLTARLRGASLAKVIQLALEYDPHPPFTAGSPRSAGRLVTASARLALRREFRQPA